MHMFTKEKDAKIEEMKKDLFASMKDVVSQDPELRKQNSIRILEIGVGTGQMMHMILPPDVLCCAV